MTFLVSTLIIASLAAVLYVHVLRGDDFFGTIVPVIVSAVVGVIWTGCAVVVICTGTLKDALPALVVGLGMIGKTYVEYQTSREAKEIFARWGRRG